jgi:hypothetical protein
MKSLQLICLSIVSMCVAVMAQNPRPFVSELSPVSALPGGSGFTLHVQGTGFVTGAVMNWNGSPRTTQVLSSTAVTATISATDVAKVGTALVTVTNPAPGGGISNSANFPVRRTWTGVAMALEPQVINPGPGTVSADFNGDGKLDLATTNNPGGGLTIRLGKGDGTFLPGTTYLSNHYYNALVVGDFNGDGKMDIAVSLPFLCGGCGGEPSYLLQMFLGAGDGTFKHVVPRTVFYGFPLAAGDFNGDGKLDLIVTGTDYNGEFFYPSIALGNGDGTFQKGTSLVIMNQFSYPGVGDFNGDGKLDVAMPDLDSFQGSPITSVYLGNGDGTFATPVAYPGNENTISTAAVADVNNDGKLDIINDSIQVLLGNGDGTFKDSGMAVATNTVAGIVVGDFNGDGKIDFVSKANPTNSPFGSLVFLGNGDGSFQVVPIEGGAQVLQAADFNGDGKLDLLTTAGIFVQTAANLFPTSMNFGAIKVNTKSTQTAIVTNVGITTMTITSVQLTGTGASGYSITNGCGGSLAPGKSCQVQVVFAPTALVAYDASLTVTIPGAPPSAVLLFGAGD